MQKCPFHEDSTGIEQEGELSAIRCSRCGDYRISTVALAELTHCSEPPKGWFDMLARNRLICTRDTRMLMTA